MATNTTEKPQNPDFIELGVLWRRQGPKGDFYSGVINLKQVGHDKDVPCKVFLNKNKRPDKKDPDLRIYLNTPKEGSGAAPAEKTAPAKPTPPAAPIAPDSDVL